MVAAEFLGYINSFSAVNYVGVEDLADRANFQWNVIVILICMALVTIRQYYMAPLVCYFPTTFSGGNAESYVTNLCWVEGTIPINLTSGVVPHDNFTWDDSNPDMMNYYQWVPLVLGLQAILYYIPRIIWSIFTYNRTGTDLQNFVRTANAASRDDGEKREKIVHHLAKTIEVMLFSRRQFHEQRDTKLAKFAERLPAKRHGNNLIYYYLFIKALYVFVGGIQIAIMYAFLRFDQKEGYFFFGFRIMHDIANGKPWTETQVFPRVGVCRQTIQHVAAANKLFAQCVLPINMLNEKIYVFLYFFLVSVMLFTIFSIPLWLWRISPRRQRHFIKRFLKMAEIYHHDDPAQREIISRFVVEFLRQDGHFLLRMLSMNSGDLITVEIVCALFGYYQNSFKGKDFRGVKVPKKLPNEYGEPRKAALNGTARQPPYPTSIEGDFLSMQLQPGGYASTKQRPLPSAPAEESPPYPEDDFEELPPPIYPLLGQPPASSNKSVPQSPPVPTEPQPPPPQASTPTTKSINSTALKASDV